MSPFVFCRVCLAHDIRMYPLHKTRYQEIYEKYTGTKLITGDGRLEKVCYICNTLLLRFHKFLQMSQKAEKHLKDICHNGFELTASNTSTLANEMQHLSMTTFSSLTLTESDQTVTACASPARTEPTVCSIQDITEPSVSSTVQDIPEPAVSTIQDVAVKIESVDYEENDYYLAEDLNNDIGVENDDHMDVENDNHIDVEDLNHHVDGEDLNHHVDVEDLNHHVDGEDLNHHVDGEDLNHHVDVEDLNHHVDVEDLNHHVDVEDLNHHVDVEDLNHHVDVEDLNHHVDVEDLNHHVDVEDLNHHVDVENESYLVPFDIQPTTEIEMETPKKPDIKISDVRVTLERIQVPKLRSKKRGHHCQFCPRRFRSAALLRRHKCQQARAPVYLQTLKRGPAQYRCELCDRHFKHKSMFQVHHRTHTGEKPYQCKYCDRVFNDKSNCRKHINKHLTSKHACFMCELTFTERRSLLKHAVEHIL